MRIFYLGDVMGRPGRDIVAAHLPALRKRHKIDFVIAQAENVSHGKSITPGHVRELQAAGVDAFSGGNHTIERPSILPLLADAAKPITAPMNQLGAEPSWGYKRIATPKGTVLLVSLLGTVFPGPIPTRNPLQAIDELLHSLRAEKFAAIVVNFHGDYSSEKRVMGYYLDGRVSAVIGDHWHVPTADAMILPGGTAHMTDVGMCGTLHSSLGVSKEIIIARWRDGAKIKNDIAEGAPFQLNGVVVEVSSRTRLAKDIKPINLQFRSL